MEQLAVAMSSGTIAVVVNQVLYDNKMFFICLWIIINVYTYNL